MDDSATQVTNNNVTVPTVQKKKGSRKFLVFLVILGLLALCCCLPFTAFGLFGYLELGNQCVWKGPLSSVDSGSCSRNVELEQDNVIRKNNDQMPVEDNNSSNNGTSFDEDTSSLFNLGSTFQVAVDNVRRNGNDYEIEMSIKNTSDSEQTFSTVLYLQLQSELTESYNQNFFTGRYRDEDAQLDSTIPAGATKRGVVVFTVDNNPSNLTLKVSEGLFSNKFVEFDIK